MVNYTPPGGKNTFNEITVDGPATLGTSEAPAGNVQVRGALEVNSTAILKGLIMSQTEFSHLGTKVGFFNVATVTQQALIADPAGGTTVDTEARTAINAILDLLVAYGLMSAA